LGKGGGEIGDRYELPKSTTSITRIKSFYTSYFPSRRAQILENSIYFSYKHVVTACEFSI
jgi:hypothetical protein